MFAVTPTPTPAASAAESGRGRDNEASRQSWHQHPIASADARVMSRHADGHAASTLGGYHTASEEEEGYGYDYFGVDE